RGRVESLDRDARRDFDLSRDAPPNVMTCWRQRLRAARLWARQRHRTRQINPCSIRAPACAERIAISNGAALVVEHLRISQFDLFIAVRRDRKDARLKQILACIFE